MSGRNGVGKCGSTQPARHSTGTFTNDRIKMTVRKVVKVELREDYKLQKVLQMML